MMATFLHFVLYRFVSELWQASKTSATEKKDHWKAVMSKIEAAVLWWSNGINVHTNLLKQDKFINFREHFRNASLYTERKKF